MKKNYAVLFLAATLLVSAGGCSKEEAQEPEVKILSEQEEERSGDKSEEENSIFLLQILSISSSFSAAVQAAGRQFWTLTRMEVLLEIIRIVIWVPMDRKIPTELYTNVPFPVSLRNR